MAAPATYPLRHPPPDHIWLHVDRFGKANGRVWAVQYWQGGRCRWRTACDVRIQSKLWAASNEQDGRQPKAWLVAHAAETAVQWRGPVVHLVPRVWLTQDREGG